MLSIDNINIKLKDDLIEEITSGSKISIAAAYFSMYAYKVLKDVLNAIDKGQKFTTAQAIELTSYVNENTLERIISNKSKLTAKEVDDLYGYVDEEVLMRRGPKGHSAYSYHEQEEEDEEFEEFQEFEEFEEFEEFRGFTNHHATQEDLTVGKVLLKILGGTLKAIGWIFVAIFSSINKPPSSSKSKRKVGSPVTIKWSNAEGEIIDTSHDGIMVRDISTGKVNTYKDSELKDRKM